MSVARGRLAVGLAVCAVAGLTVPVVPAYAEEGSCSEIQAETTDVDEVEMPSAPLEELRIKEATDLLERQHKSPGQGVGVAVVDSGIAGEVPVTVVRELRDPRFARAADIEYYHGSAVAGLIAGRPRPDGGGPVGIAPAAGLYDVRVYDTPEDSDDAETLGLTDAGVIHGLNQVADIANAVTPRIRIVNVSLALPPSDGLARAIKRLERKGVVVVAAAGNRPASEDDPVLGDFAGVPEPGEGEDAARVVYPAGYESVVAATSSVPRDVNALEYIVQNSATDIAAPTIEGVSYAVNGVSCHLSPEAAASSWAAAEISGVLALLMSAFPEESPDQIVARLYRTATGPGDLTTKLTGHGVAQTVEALQRPLTFDADGRAESSETNNTVLKAQAPRPEADVLADTRRDAVWWGLVGSGVLVVALLLRPVLARRRTGER